jgi:predicted esterase
MKLDTSEGKERELKAEIKLYYDIEIPSHTPAPLLIALHGYGESKRRMMREAKQIAPAGFAIAALQGLHQHFREPRSMNEPPRVGFAWLTSYKPEDSIALHQRALIDLIASLARERIADEGRIFLLGFSQACALNYRFAFTCARFLRGVVGMCGGMLSDWATNENYKRTDAAIFHLAAARDEFYPTAKTENYSRLLRQRASDVEFKIYDAAHEIAPAMREDVRAWLAARAK